MNLLDDIYYSKEYISLYLKEDETIFEFKYQEDEYIFHNIAIKRPIKKIGDIDTCNGYFDLETAYGYGGFVINTDDQEFIANAVNQYVKKCMEENIIAEFIRFHPFNESPIKHRELFDMNLYDRDVVYVDLELSREERWNSYSSKTRNILRKCEKELTFEQSVNIEKFVDLYEQTMNKNNAGEFYYFSKDYYEQLLKNSSIDLYVVKKDEQVISSAFFMQSDAFCHYHLSANDYNMRQYNANYLILDKMFELAKSNGKKYLHLGGGTTSLKDDSLLKFKQKFSKLTKPFYISGKIYNKDIYDKYIQLWEEQSIDKVKYFLKYRLEIK